MEEIDQRIQNLEAKYHDQIQLLEDSLKDEQNRHEEEEKKMKKEVREIRRRLERLEAFLKQTHGDEIDLDKIHQSLSDIEKSAEYNDQEGDDDDKARNLSESDKKQSDVPVEQPITPETTGVFAYLFDKYKQNPLSAGLVEITGNSFDVYEQNLLPSLVDEHWDGNHWLSENVSNSYVTINFINFTVKIDKYRLRVGCSNGLGRFVSWDFEGVTKDNKKVLLDKVVDCAEITREHPEIEIPIQNDTYIRSIKVMMRGKSTDRNYKMRFRNIEIFGEIQFDK